MFPQSHVRGANQPRRATQPGASLDQPTVLLRRPFSHAKIPRVQIVGSELVATALHTWRDLQGAGELRRGDVAFPTLAGLEPDIPPGGGAPTGDGAPSHDQCNTVHVGYHRDFDHQCVHRSVLHDG